MIQSVSAVSNNPNMVSSNNYNKTNVSFTGAALENLFRFQRYTPGMTAQERSAVRESRILQSVALLVLTVFSAASLCALFQLGKPIVSGQG